MSSEPAPMIDEDEVWFSFISHCSLKTEKSESEDVLFLIREKLKKSLKMPRFVAYLTNWAKIKIKVTTYKFTNFSDFKGGECNFLQYVLYKRGVKCNLFCSFS
jgi:hypothetical protein